MSIAQPPQREQEDQLDSNTTDQPAEAAKHRESSARVKPSGVKKGWDKKARRRHTVSSTKFTRDDRDDKLPGHLSSAPANTPKTPAQQLIEEVFENVTVDELLSESPNDIEPTEIQEEAENAEDSKPHEPSKDTQPEADDSADEKATEDIAESAESLAVESVESDPDDTEPIAVVTSEEDDKLPGHLSSSNRTDELEEGEAAEDPTVKSATVEDQPAEPELVESFTTEHEHWPRKRNGRRHDFVANNYPDIEPIELEVETVEAEVEAVENEADTLLQELDASSRANENAVAKEKAHLKPKKNKKEQDHKDIARPAKEQPEHIAAKSKQSQEQSEKKRRSWKPSKPVHQEQPAKPAESKRQNKRTAPVEPVSQERSAKLTKPARQERTAKPAEAASQERPTKPAEPTAKSAPRYRYIKSPSLEQAFRNLAHLNPGAAWRSTRIPLVVFFVLFSILALAVADQAPAIDALNATLNTAIQSTRGTLDAFFITLTTFGDPLPMVAICLVVCLILALAKKWDSLAFFITNTVLAAVFVQALKLIFAVPRPGDPTLVPIPGSFSFPSAHSFCSLIVFGMIGLLIFRALIRKGITRNVALTPGVILLVLALIIGISRIYVGVHWPSDVLGGWLLAGIWLPFAGALYTVGSRKPAKQPPIS